MRKNNDLLIAPIGEGALLLAIAAIGWALRAPLLFTSLGPTAYELVEKPESKSARPYNVIVGHFIGIGCGFMALAILGAWAAPKVASAGFIVAPRMWAAVISVTLTALFTLAAGASQPASLSTTLLISLGSMQRARDAVAIAAAVLILTAIGEPVRRLRLKAVRRDR